MRKTKLYKLYDEKGLYLLVNKAGKYFRYDYRFSGKRKTLALGVYPEIKPKEAKEKRDESRKLIKSGIDPAQHKKETKALQLELSENSFKSVAIEWITKNMATITDPKKIGELLRAIDAYEGHLITRCALRLAPLTFVRPGELRKAEWKEINLNGDESYLKTDGPQKLLTFNSLMLNATRLKPPTTMHSIYRKEKK